MIFLKEEWEALREKYFRQLLNNTEEFANSNCEQMSYIVVRERCVGSTCICTYKQCVDLDCETAYKCIYCNLNSCYCVNK